jgi:two-component sensor histidine kinase
VSWKRLEEGSIRLEWLERDGPTVHSPLREGFGHLVLTELVAQALQSTSKLEFRSDGVHRQLDIPATYDLTAPTPPTAETLT